MSFTDEERAELTAAVSRTADMVAGLLDALDVMRVALEAGSFALCDQAFAALTDATAAEYVPRGKGHIWPGARY